MSGAGWTPAGLLAAGQEQYTSSEQEVSELKSQFVPLYDLATKEFIRDETGRVKLIHWVDQAVALALGVTNGTHLADAQLGNKLKFIQRNNAQVLRAEVEDAVRTCLKDLIDRRDINVVRLDIDTSRRGLIYVAVNYVNLRLYPNAPTAFKFSF